MTTIEKQLDLFTDPAPVQSPQSETLPCGKCGGRGKFHTTDEPMGYGNRIQVTCDACQGTKQLTVPVKPPCPASAASVLSEPGTMVAMVDFAKVMVAAGYAAKVQTWGDLDQRKAKQCCNALLHGVASDRPEPSVTCWKLAAETLVMDSGFWDFCHVADDPDPGACARRVAAADERIKAEKARGK